MVSFHTKLLSVERASTVVKGVFSHQGTKLTKGESFFVSIL